jgi:hypothetical protein
VRIAGFEASAADMRSYATLFMVAKTVCAGYMIASLQEGENIGAVRTLLLVISHSDKPAFT